MFRSSNWGFIILPCIFHSQFLHIDCIRMHFSFAKILLMLFLSVLIKKKAKIVVVPNDSSEE